MTIDKEKLLQAFPPSAMRVNGFDVGLVIRELLATAPTPPQPIYSALNFVCTALPGPGNECAFVELENDAGESLGHGEWRNRDDGLVELHIAAPQPIYDEVKESDRFSKWANGIEGYSKEGTHYNWERFDMPYEKLEELWQELSKSRAKAGEVGHD